MSDTAAPPPPAPSPATAEEPPVEFHKPKPVHNWREFLTEIGVVVIGVCIALAAEQAVEFVHWKIQVAQAKQVIATELASNLVNAATRLRTQTCTEHRIDDLARILDSTSKDGSLPALGDIRRPPRGTWPSGAWESVVASQTATHFPRQQLADLAAAYKNIQRIEYFGDIEVKDWDELYTMVGPGRRLDPVSESELRNALSEARTKSREIAALGLLMANRVKILHLPFNGDELKRIASAKRPLSSATPADICLPIGQAVSSYGQGARMMYLPVDLENAVNQFPDFSGDER